MYFFEISKIWFANKSLLLIPNIVFQLERGVKISISSLPNHFITSARISGFNGK